MAADEFISSKRALTIFLNNSVETVPVEITGLSIPRTFPHTASPKSFAVSTFTTSLCQSSQNCFVDWPRKSASS